MVIYYDPPGSEPEIQAWLGNVPSDRIPQPKGDLGTRLRSGFRWGFNEGNLVCAVGTDIPELDRGMVEEAFSSLSDPGGPDIVVGPAFDGGYYLLGLRRPTPDLFERIPWSTEGVLDTTIARAARLGLTVASLPPLADVDRVEDLPAEFRSPR
jgi:rSAM/selenodomain-associated transferase 1